MPIGLTLVALNYETNFENVSFGTLVLSLVLLSMPLSLVSALCVGV